MLIVSYLFVVDFQVLGEVFFLERFELLSSFFEVCLLDLFLFDFFLLELMF